MNERIKMDLKAIIRGLGLTGSGWVGLRTLMNMKMNIWFQKRWDFLHKWTITSFSI